MADYFSHAGQIMLAIQNVVKDQQPPNMANEEVRIREDWLSPTGDPYRGASVVYQGEQYSEGTIGTQDIGYVIGIIFATHRTGDSELPNDTLMEWYEKTRRRLMDQRALADPLVDASAPAEHVCIMMPGRTLTNTAKYPNYLIRMLVVAVWVRELPVTL